MNQWDPLIYLFSHCSAQLPLPFRCTCEGPFGPWKNKVRQHSGCKHNVLVNATLRLYRPFHNCDAFDCDSLAACGFAVNPTWLENGDRGKLQIRGGKHGGRLCRVGLEAARSGDEHSVNVQLHMADRDVTTAAHFHTDAVDTSETSATTNSLVSLSGAYSGPAVVSH